MASVYLKRGKYWARLCGDRAPGKWSGVPTGEVDKERALEFAKTAQRAIDKRNEQTGADGTLRGWVTQWKERRKKAVHDWKKEFGRLEGHVLPTLGHVPVAKITTKHVAELVHTLRFDKQLAPRTVRSIYSVLVAVMRDAAIEGLISVSPCTLTEAQLGSIVDKNPEWRTGALFTREEAEIMISDRRIPLDRRVTYAFGLLAGLRPGEAAALRWRNYDQTCEPLGRLTVALAYSTTNNKLKETKTKAVRLIPVHPVLAILLAEWRTGWIVMFGREPGPEDLIIPLPPETIKRRTSRTGEPFRFSDYTLRRWTEIDERRLGWRHRSVYDTKSTFITLAIDDGVNRDILRDRITHAKPRRDAFDGYDRGPHWKETCTELAKLSIRYVATTLLPADIDATTSENLNGGVDRDGSGGGFRMAGPAHDSSRMNADARESTPSIRSSCDQSRDLMLATVATASKEPE